MSIDLVVEVPGRLVAMSAALVASRGLLGAMTFRVMAVAFAVVAMREFLAAMTFRVGTAALHVWRPAFRWWQSSWRFVRSTCSRVPVAFALRGASCRLVPSRHPDGADRLRGEGTELFAAGDRVIAGGGRLSVGEDRLSVGGGQLYGWGSDVSRWGCWP